MPLDAVGDQLGLTLLHRDVAEGTDAIEFVGGDDRRGRQMGRLDHMHRARVALGRRGIGSTRHGGYEGEASIDLLDHGVGSDDALFLEQPRARPPWTAAPAAC